MTDIAEVVGPLVADAATAHHCPEISWGVVIDGAIAAHGGSPNRVFRIASMTKSFTCAAVLVLRDEGLLSIDVPVSEYAPELAGICGPLRSPPITLRHLMSMTSGLATDDPWADRHLDMTPDEFDRLCAAGPRFAHRTGARFEYSNLGFGMIGRVVERVTGQRVRHHVTERLLEPLGLTRTTWDCPDHDDWARPHVVRDGGAVVDPVPPLGDGEIAPMGGLWSTVTDLAAWTTWLDDAIARPDADDWTALAPTSRREMQAPHAAVGIREGFGRHRPTDYCLGVNVRDDPTLGTVVAHSGGLPGYGSNMRWIAGRGVAAIALGNVTYAPMSELTTRMLVALHEAGLIPGRPRMAPDDVDRAARRLVDLLNSWDDTAPNGLFADNVALDLDLQRRAHAARELNAAHGHIHIDSITCTGAADASITAHTDDGTEVRISLRLAPLPDSLIQEYEVTAVEEPA
ncbi:MAG: Penicillin-binding protein [Actinomycetota bacterium]|jgi:CubicO group peptidase (beta-lactamase class C family)